MVPHVQTHWYHMGFSSESRSHKDPLRYLMCIQQRWLIWLTDHQVASIGLQLRDDLGDWIRRRLTKGIEGHTTKAKKTLDECGVPAKELRTEWTSQQASQLSLRAHKLLICLHVTKFLSIFQT
jgi:hypothetical protein